MVDTNYILIKQWSFTLNNANHASYYIIAYTILTEKAFKLGASQPATGACLPGLLKLLLSGKSVAMCVSSMSYVGSRYNRLIIGI